MTSAQVIVLATPVFLVLMALEWWWGVARGRNTFLLHDAASSIGLGMLSQWAGVFSTALTLGVYTWVHEHAALWRLPATSPWVWLGALVAYDFLYYWLHRAGHRVALFWAAHVVHHQSEDYNLSTALRQTGSGWVGGWLFYLPMALAGVPPLVFASVALIDLLYQFWVHTQQVGRLGWFDRWFCSPSNHRVHHGVNDRYLDKNYGGIFMLWDHLFGSFADEHADEPVVYGTRAPLRSFNPLWANLEVYAALLHDSRHAARWADKLRVWFKPPGWRPADVAARFPKPAFDIAQVRRWNPPLPRGRAVGVALLFAAALAVTAVFLWWGHTWAWAAQAAGAALALGLLVAMGRVAQAGSGPAEQLA
jgi:sterol desaturase/sphingolipid hydroxylase (fatty acid hydroxylase superfamily)